MLILDDICQSVDGPVRVSTMEYIVQEFPEWQLILTAHDRLWREQLRALLRGKEISSFEITSWTLEHGPEVRPEKGDLSANLRWALDQAEPVAIARLLEQIADVLSWTMAVRVQRRRGDLYTLDNLWNPVRKKLERTTAAEAAASINRFLHLRNVLGAHANAWAESVSLSEAKEFG